MASEEDPLRPPAEEETGSGSTDRVAAAAAAGDMEELGKLYLKLIPCLHAYASLRLGRGRTEEAGDVVSEVWVRTTSQISRYDTSRPFRGWLFGIARNVLREAQRRAARAVRLRSPLTSSSGWVIEMTAQISTASAKIARDEQLTAFVDWARDSLSDYQREVLVQRGLKRRPSKEVALLLGRSDKAIRDCWSEVRKRITQWSGASDPFASIPGDPPLDEEPGDTATETSP